MRFTVSAVLAMAVTAFAQTPDFDPVFTPAANAEIEAGSTFEITWEAPAKYASGTISIHLIGGKDQGSQVPLADIAAGIPNSAGKYTWTVGKDLGAAAVYGLVVRYESSPEVFQYSNPFHIKAAAVEPSKSYDAPVESTTGVPETTVTTKHGEVTVTLSSCTTSSTSVVVVVPTSTPAPVTSSAIPTFSSVVVPQNSTVVPPPTKPAGTSSTAVVPPVSSETVTPPPASAASGRTVSGVLALVGAAAAAIFVL